MDSLQSDKSGDEIESDKKETTTDDKPLINTDESVNNLDFSSSKAKLTRSSSNSNSTNSNEKEQKSTSGSSNYKAAPKKKKVANKKKKSENLEEENIKINENITKSVPEALNDETLDGFSIEDNTMMSTALSVTAAEEGESTEMGLQSQDAKATDINESNSNVAKNPVIEAIKKQRKRRGSGFEIDQHLGSKITVSQLFVYKWPSDEPIGELCMLQEQVSDYLDIKSFKRKYPDLARRTIDIKEREFLKDNKIVSETQCDLGLVALSLSDVLEIMSQDYPEKYKEFNTFLNEKRKTVNASSNTKRKSESFKSKTIDGDKMKEMIKKAIKSAAKFNSTFQRERKEERETFFDLQTMRIQVPKNRTFQLSSELTKPGAYPVALINGQYQNYYKDYTNEELKYMPLNTVIYTAPTPDPLLYMEWKKSMSSIDPNKDSSDEENMLMEKACMSANAAIHDSTRSIHSIIKPVEIILKICYVCNKSSHVDQMISCSSCSRFSHPNCLELNPKLVDWNCIRNYKWQCMDCKICSHCNEPHDEAKMMFCDRCDRGFHTYCVGVKEVPIGSWFCLTCTATDSSNRSMQHQNLNNSSIRTTPIKNRLHSITSMTPNSSPNTVSKRGRPVGSLNKQKENKVKELKKVELLEFNDDSTIDISIKNESILSNTPKKSRGRPRKIMLENAKTSYENDYNDEDDDEQMIE